MFKKKLLSGIILLSWISSIYSADLSIKASKQQITMGETVEIEANLKTGKKDNSGQYILLPFVDRNRWGSHEFVNQNGEASFYLPLPNTGVVSIKVVDLPSDTDHWMGIKNKELLMAGHAIIERGIHSNTITIDIKTGEYRTKHNANTLFGMQYEPWFTSGYKSWLTSEAVPIMGFYNSFNEKVLRQHILWMMELGVDFILPDWSNHIWGCEHWREREPSVNKILHATECLLETLSKMRTEGLPVPKVALMPGLSNGPPATMQALNEEIEWIYYNYLKNPRFNGLWQNFKGQPLLVILDVEAKAQKSEKEVNDENFTVRWMSTQNQIFEHHKLGYWTWMDGIIDAPITDKNGEAEAATVSTAFFHRGG
jgi:hypothetical protein